MKHVLCMVFSTSSKTPQRQRVIIQDEIYTKNLLLHHGRTLFGRTTDDPQPIPYKNCVRSYDILYVSWTHIYLENFAHLKIEFVVSL